MCYRGGPRCSAHAKLALDRAVKSGEQSRIIKALEDYRHTPAGIKETSNHDPEYADQLQQERDQMLANRGVSSRRAESRFGHLKDPEDISPTFQTDNMGIKNLEGWETEATLGGWNRPIGIQDITEPRGYDWELTRMREKIFAHKKVKAPNGVVMDHVVLTNPHKVPTSMPDHNALVRGSLTVAGKQRERGMHDQFLIDYALVEMKNSETGEMEKGLYIETISVPKAEKGKGLASWLLAQAEEAFPGVKVPSTSPMTEDGVQFMKRLSEKDPKYKGVLRRPNFNPHEEPYATYDEERDFLG